MYKYGLFLGITLFGFTCWPEHAEAFLQSLDLGEVIFVYGAPELDRDGDGLKDELEYKLADAFKPKLVFDSAEANRQSFEPVTLFQVRPSGCIGQGCPLRNGAESSTIKIVYALLFQRDGGYGPSSSCGNAHNGDNQGVTVVLETFDGRYIWDVKVLNGHWEDPPSHIVLGDPTSGAWAQFEGTHPIVFLSAHKHHQYFNTSLDEEDSVYSDWGCNDDVNGQGAQILPSLRGEVCRDMGISGGVHKVGCQVMPYNVGEPENHNVDFFVNDLSGLGYNWENAWSSKPFKGGLGDDGGDTSSILSMWSNDGFQFGSSFPGYLPSYYFVVGQDLLLLF